MLVRKLVPPSLSRVALRGAIVDLASRGGALHASRLSIGFCTARAALPANLTLASAKVIEPLPEPPKETFQFPILDVPESVAVKSFLEPGSVVRPVPLRRAIFEVALRKDIVLQAVRYTRNKRRQPKRTKRMSELRGSNKKPRPQKGTGMSQVGHRRNSAWVGGQKAHGPVIRDYSIGLNKKQRALALMMALTAKFREGNLFVFDEFAPPTHYTREMAALLEKHGFGEKKLLLVDCELNRNLELSVGNLPHAQVMQLKHINTYEVMRRERLAITAAAFEELQERLVNQYKSRGKRGAVSRNMSDYLKTVQQGRELLASAKM